MYNIQTIIFLNFVMTVAWWKKDGSWMVYCTVCCMCNGAPQNILGLEPLKALIRPWTLRAGCSKAKPKIFAPPQTSFPGRRMAKIQSAGDGHYLHLQTQFGEDRCTQFRVIVVTDPHTHKYTHTHKQTHRQDRLQYTAPLSLARSVNIQWHKRCSTTPVTLVKLTTRRINAIQTQEKK